MRTSVGKLLTRLEPTGMFSLEEGGEKLSFRHELLRDAAYGRISAQTKREWHEIAAETLAYTGAFPEEVAYHYLKTENTVDALKYCQAAAKRLYRLPQKEEALFYVEQAENLAREQKNVQAQLDIFPLRFDIESRDLSIEQAQAWLGEEGGKKDLWTSSEAQNHLANLRAQFLFDRNAYRESKTTLEAVKIKPNAPLNFDMQLLKGRLLGRLGEHREAIGVCMEALREKDLQEVQKGELWNLLGQIAYHGDREIKQGWGCIFQSITSFRKRK